MITTQSTDARVVNELGLIDGCFDETGFSLDLVSTTGLLDLLAAIAMDWSLTMLFFCGPREREEGCPPDLDLPFVDNHPPPPELRLEGGTRVQGHPFDRSHPFPP